jgi:molecular chaperone DnaJ
VGLRRPVNGFHRSLTRRQRDLIQQYADDVEGRSSTEGTSSSGKGDRESSSSHGDDEKRDTGATGKDTQAHERHTGAL